jgi:hypothetical protein
MGWSGVKKDVCLLFGYTDVHVMDNGHVFRRIYVIGTVVPLEILKISLNFVQVFREVCAV